MSTSRSHSRGLRNVTGRDVELLDRELRGLVAQRRGLGVGLRGRDHAVTALGQRQAGALAEAGTRAGDHDGLRHVFSHLVVRTAWLMVFVGPRSSAAPTGAFRNGGPHADTPASTPADIAAAPLGICRKDAPVPAVGIRIGHPGIATFLTECPEYR